MKLHPDLREATFVARLNRFAARMRLDGRDVIVHVPNSGRLGELLMPDNPMLLVPAPEGAQRKTAYDLALVEVDGVLVSADARVPNALVREAIEADRLPAFAGYDALVAEVPLEESRIDLRLSSAGRTCYVEVKSVTLVENGIGLFPDAPTERGRKHMLSLVKAVKQGHRAAVVFVIQRPDARGFSTNREADPRFHDALEAAIGSGVEAYAHGCQVTRTRIDFSDALPVLLPS